MKLKLFTFLFIFLVGIGAQAQNHDPCGTTIEEQRTSFDFVKNNSSLLKNNLLEEVPIKIHIIGSDNGTFALDSTIILEELNLANEVFSDINVVFTRCGPINYILNNNYVTFIKNDDEIICNIHDEPTAINLYIPPNLKKSNGDDLCGYAYNFDIKPRVFVEKGCASNGSTLTHELGHAFSLLHTHSTSNGEELANGSNCSDAGDLLCDTPADPKLNNDLVDNNCVYIGTALDNQQNPYMPSTENLMSYAPKECRTVFTPQQLAQMENFYIEEGGFLACQNLPTATNDLDVLNKISLFPNPSTDGVFYINELPENAKMKILNSTGKTLFQNNLNQHLPQKKLLELMPLSPGVYFVQFIFNQQMITKKIIRL